MKKDAGFIEAEISNSIDRLVALVTAEPDNILQNTDRSGGRSVEFYDTHIVNNSGIFLREIQNLTTLLNQERGLPEGKFNSKKAVEVEDIALAILKKVQPDLRLRAILQLVQFFSEMEEKGLVVNPEIGRISEDTLTRVFAATGYLLRDKGDETRGRRENRVVMAETSESQHAGRTTFLRAPSVADWRIVAGYVGIRDPQETGLIAERAASLRTRRAQAQLQA